MGQQLENKNKYSPETDSTIRTPARAPSQLTIPHSCGGDDSGFPAQSAVLYAHQAHDVGAVGVERLRGAGGVDASRRVVGIGACNPN